MTHLATLVAPRWCSPIRPNGLWATGSQFLTRLGLSCKCRLHILVRLRNRLLAHFAVDLEAREARLQLAGFSKDSWRVALVALLFLAGGSSTSTRSAMLREQQLSPEVLSPAPR